MSGYMSRELTLFACSVCQGLFLMLVYDTLRILRGVKKPSASGQILGDLLYWIFTALFLFVCFYRENSGVLRAYLFAGIFLGMLVWNAFPGPFYVSRGIRFLRKVERVVSIPARAVQKVGKKLRKRLKFLARHARMKLSAKCGRQGRTAGEKGPRRRGKGNEKERERKSGVAAQKP